MSCEQCLSSLKLQRIKLYSQISLDDVAHADQNCCEEPLNDIELNLMDSCFQNSTKLSDVERCTVYFIAGYVAFKEDEFASQNMPETSSIDSEFTNLVSRGMLQHPTVDLFDLGLFLYAYHKSLPEKKCLNRQFVAFQLIYDFSHFDFSNSKGILWRFLKTFSKGFAKMKTDQIKQEKKSVKRRRTNYE